MKRRSDVIVKVKVAQSCLILCDPLISSSVHGILQARILEWVAIPFCRGSSQPRDRTQVSYIAGKLFKLDIKRHDRKLILDHYNFQFSLKSFFFSKNMSSIS